MPEERQILVVEDVHVSFDGFTVLDGLDFAIDYGEIRFLIGPNGAGKTTLLDIVTGKTRPSGGRVTFDAAGATVNVLHHSEDALVRYGIARKFQTAAVFPSLSVFDNLGVAACFRRHPASFFRAMAAEDLEKVEATMERVGLAERRHHPAGALSHGENQWLEIAMLLVQEPKLLLLDEPVAGMTRRERDQTGALLHEIGRDRSVLVVEHDMHFVRQFARTVTVLHLGRVLREGTMEEIQQDPMVLEAYLGHNKARAAPV